MAEPTLPQQVTKLYDLIAGYHATHLLEIGRQLGVWEALTAEPGMSSDALATRLGTDPFYTDVLVRTAFAFELIEHDGDGWRMAAHFDQILGTPSACSSRTCAIAWPRRGRVAGRSPWCSP